MRSGMATHPFITAEQMAPGQAPIRSGHRPRRGVVTLWTLLMVPVMLVLFAVVVEGVHLWLARVELENALEAAALAAVKEWAETPLTVPIASGWTNGARTVGQQYAAANTINQTSVPIDANIGTFDPTSNPNENGPCGGDLIFGAIVSAPPYVFASNLVPSCVVDEPDYAVRAQAEYTVPSLIGGFLGINFGGPFTVSAQTTAMYDCTSQRPRLIRVEAGNFHCPTWPPP